MTDRFMDCIPFTLKQECNVYTGTPEDWRNPKNFDDDPDDPGGATQCGITQNEYAFDRKKRGLPYQDVRLITQDEGLAIYRDNYWLPECPKLPPGLDLLFFDEAVNAGPYAAMVLLQLALHVSSDGVWGPITEAAVQSISDVPAVIRAFTVARESRYRHTRNFWKFGTDWIRRSEETEADSLKMVA